MFKNEIKDPLRRRSNFLWHSIGSEIGQVAAVLKYKFPATAKMIQEDVPVPESDSGDSTGSSGSTMKPGRMDKGEAVGKECMD